MKKHLVLLSALLLQVVAVSVFAKDKAKKAQDEYVDLGLSVKWATCNVGAATPLEVGKYYNWNYKLQQDEDWRIPSNDEMIELLSYCTWTFVENADSCGFKVTSDIEGFTDRSIFFPIIKERIPIQEIVRINDIKYTFKVVDSTYDYRGNYMTNFINDENRPGYLDCGGHYPMPWMHKNGYPGLDNFHIRPVKPLDSQTKQNRVLPQVELRESYPVRNDSKVIDVIDMSEFEGLGITTVDEALIGKIADLDVIFNEDGRLTDYVAPKYYDIDMYRSSKVMPQDPLNIDIPGVEFQVDNNGLRQIVSLPEQCYTDIEKGHGYVDLGLSVKWATCNIGADSPEKTGGKYAWGEVSTKSDYTWRNYRFSNGSDSYWSVGLSKYNSDSKLGPVDMREVLEPEDDAAHVNWGGKWRIPTAGEFQELANNCTFVWSALNGTEGCLIISNKPGYTDRFIFLPATRSRTDGVGTADGYYWSGTTNLTDRRGSVNPGPCSSYAFYIWNISYFEIMINLQNHRSFGLPIRPVCPSLESDMEKLIDSALNKGVKGLDVEFNIGDNYPSMRFRD